MEKGKEALILRLSVDAKDEEPDNSWLPIEMPPSSEIKALDKKESPNETQLKVCFVEGKFFLADGNQWTPIESEKRLKISQGSILLGLEAINPSALPKKNQSNTSFLSSTPKTLRNPFDISQNLSVPSIKKTVSSGLSKADPLDFLETNLRSSPFFESEEK